MKPDITCHLGVLHSPLVARVFSTTMRQLQIPAELTRHVTRRNTRHQGPGICLDELSDRFDTAFRNADRAEYAAACRQLDGELVDLSGIADFHAYIPHCNKILYQEIICHPRCAGYSFLEEGYTSMQWNTIRSSRLTWQKQMRMWFRALRTRPNFRFQRPMFDIESPRYTASYAISRHAFKNMPNRVDVAPSLPPLPSGEGPPNTYVVLDTCYLHHPVSWDDYESAVVGAILSRSLPASEIRIKFHFADTKAGDRFASLAKLMKQSGLPDPVLLEMDFSIEENLTRDDIMLYATTSLGYYSAIIGAQTSCFADKLPGISVDDWIVKGWLPEDFREVTGAGQS